MTITYEELQDYVQAKLQVSETEFTDQFPKMVRQAEERIYRDVYFPALQTHATTTMVDADPYIEVPSDLVAVKSLSYFFGDDQIYLQPKDLAFIRTAYPTVSSQGAPRYYARFDENYLLIGPSPAQDYLMQIDYYYDPESIVTAGTTWLSENAERLLCAAAVVEGATFLKIDSEEMMKEYKSQYNEALDGLVKVGEARSRRDAYRDGD